MTPPPFLRSPPFPGVPASVAAISLPMPAGSSTIPDDVLDAIAEARVGGDFWGAQAPQARIVVRAGVAVGPNACRGLLPSQIGILPSAQAGAGMGASPKGEVLPAGCDPWSLIAGAQSVHAPMDDELAIIAGLLGVVVFGPDGLPIPAARLREAARTHLSAAHYRDCFSGKRVEAADILPLLADWRRHIDGNRHIVAASGMAFWKREAIRNFLWDGQASPPFLPPGRGLARARRTGGALAIWPSRVPPTTIVDAADMHVPIVRVEDGFLRSRGLGAALHPPGSVVIDRTGLYYNARVASDLETLLATHTFPAALVDRARRLRTRVCAAGVTKYGPEAGRMIDLPAGRRTVLAVGQVDDDLSVQLGGAGVDGNLDFLARVRRAEPDAWIIYRPHPDVQAGHRKGHLSDAAVLVHADVIDTGAPLMELVQTVDEVHVLSSLTGFEALMRGCRVTVHGMPFYAGWGLTRDLAKPLARRGRQLDVDQLVAGALILYPRYLDPVTGLPCGPELMVDRMASGSTPPMTWLIRLRVLQGKLRRFMTLSAEFLHG
ncbi:beta-3-deoxy-D-manno-oct-2-ulosonic acid transferase [Sphingobium yanoikuyae]|uniref:capsular polysaccharide export protein, LipB/KpsS family n=1 Tax=Sphingobium yanoikuyae TaxID=13690 RepID=UPI0028A7050C|nr:beta-3-deoxy-D-manno-oct-2-ulosonic acid transferase [Sphingobium yanoikuyae]